MKYVSLGLTALVLVLDLGLHAAELLADIEQEARLLLASAYIDIVTVKEQPLAFALHVIPSFAVDDPGVASPVSTVGRNETIASESPPTISLLVNCFLLVGTARIYNRDRITIILHVGESGIDKFAIANRMG